MEPKFRVRQTLIRRNGTYHHFFIELLRYVYYFLIKMCRFYRWFVGCVSFFAILLILD